MKYAIAMPALLTLIAGGCENKRCVTQAQALQLLQEGFDLEEQGKPQEARKKYKVVDLYPCELGPHVKEAFDRAVRIERAVETAYSQTQVALAAYLARNKRLPDTLADVEAEIPLESQDEFRGFRYFRKSDTEYAIAPGLIGSTTFDLSSRKR